MSLLARRRPESAEIEALAERMHGIQRTCRHCGRRGRCDAATLVIKPTLTGDALYGLCGDCTALDRRPLAMAHRMVAARLLGIDVDAVALDAEVGLLFWHETGRSDGAAYPWAHVDIIALHRATAEKFGYACPSDYTPARPARRIIW